MSDPIEWQCTCGKWIPVGFSRHVHMEERRPTFDQMHEMRRAQESGLSGITPDYFEKQHSTETVFRTKDMPVR